MYKGRKSPCIVSPFVTFDLSILTIWKFFTFFQIEVGIKQTNIKHNNKTKTTKQQQQHTYFSLIMHFEVLLEILFSGSS